MTQVQILWPEDRTVSESTIKMWASDSYYNNADRYEDDRPVYEDGRECPVELQDCIEWLNDTGEVTFPRNPIKWDAPGIQADT